MALSVRDYIPFRSKNTLLLLLPQRRTCPVPSPRLTFPIQPFSSPPKITAAHTDIPAHCPFSKTPANLLSLFRTHLFYLRNRYFPLPVFRDYPLPAHISSLPLYITVRLFLYEAATFSTIYSRTRTYPVVLRYNPAVVRKSPNRYLAFPRREPLR